MLLEFRENFWKFDIFFQGTGKLLERTDNVPVLLERTDNVPVLLERTDNFPVLLETSGVFWKKFHLFYKQTKICRIFRLLVVLYVDSVSVAASVVKSTDIADLFCRERIWGWVQEKYSLLWRAPETPGILLSQVSEHNVLKTVLIFLSVFFIDPVIIP